MKKLLTLALAATIIFSMVPATASADDDGVRLWVDGKYVVSDAKPYIVEGRTLVPIRFVAESLGYNVGWDDATRTVTISKGNEVIKMVIGQITATHNGSGTTLNREPQLMNGRTFVPIRDIAERFGKNIDWDDDDWTVIIGTGYTSPTRMQVSGRIDEAQARAIALQIVPGGTIVDFDADDDEFEIDIVLNGREYEIEIGRNGVVKEYEIDRYDDDDDDRWDNDDDERWDDDDDDRWDDDDDDDDW